MNLPCAPPKRKGATSTPKEGSNWGSPVTPGFIQTWLIQTNSKIKAESKNLPHLNNVFDQFLSFRRDHQLRYRNLKYLVHSIVSFILDFPLLNTHILHSRVYATSSGTLTRCPLTWPCLSGPATHTFLPAICQMQVIFQLVLSAWSLLAQWPRIPTTAGPASSCGAASLSAHSGEFWCPYITYHFAVYSVVQ